VFKYRELGKEFVKICLVKQACVGEGGELERMLDDAIGTSLMENREFQ